jgi:hypothetical protein
MRWFAAPYFWTSRRINVSEPRDLAIGDTDVATVEIGDLVRDQITGFTGVVEARYLFRNGCTRFSVTSQTLNAEGKPVSEVFDPHELDIVKKHAITVLRPTDIPVAANWREQLRAEQARLEAAGEWPPAAATVTLKAEREFVTTGGPSRLSPPARAGQLRR